MNTYLTPTQQLIDQICQPKMKDISTPLITNTIMIILLLEFKCNFFNVQKNFSVNGWIYILSSGVARFKKKSLVDRREDTKDTSKHILQCNRLYLN